MSGAVIIGAGQAGYKCAASLRDQGYEKPITIIGDESHYPYQRPPLSKAYMLGEMDAERLKFRSDNFYADHNIALHLNTSAISIERTEKEVQLSTGERLDYEHLVICSGARLRKLNVPGAELEGVFGLKSIDDADAIAQQLENSRHVVVVGGGFIGLEFAAVASKLGKSVTVLEAASRVMARVVMPELSEYFQQVHKSHNVNIICNAQLLQIIGNNGRVSAIATSSGDEFAADLVVVGIGVIANAQLAEAAGLKCDNGVEVDDYCRTSDENILAAGDCTRFIHPSGGEKIGLESVQNAIDQARIAALSILGKETPYSAVPWFWSDQYDVKLQMVGLRTGCDLAIRRDDGPDKFAIFHYRDEKLRAINCINNAGIALLGRRLLTAGISPTPQQAGDTDFNLKSLMR